MRTQRFAAAVASLFAAAADASDGSFTGYARSLNGRDLLFCQ